MEAQVVGLNTTLFRKRYWAPSKAGNYLFKVKQIINYFKGEDA